MKAENIFVEFEEDEAASSPEVYELKFIVFFPGQYKKDSTKPYCLYKPEAVLMSFPSVALPSAPVKLFHDTLFSGTFNPFCKSCI